MSCLCADRLKKIEDLINKKYDGSYDTLDRLKNEGTLDQIFDIGDISELFKKELETFFNEIDRDVCKDKPFLRKILAYKTNLIPLFKEHGYILSLLLNNKDAYRVFPLFMKTAIDKYEIPYYKDLTLRELTYVLNECVDMKRYYDPNSGRELFDVVPRIISTKYDNYETSKRKDQSINFYDKEEFSIFAEEDAFFEEWAKLGGTMDSVVGFISSSDGDGFGYDIYTYDPINDKENLIEVKSGRTSYLALTKNEYKTMMKTKDIEKADYYVYRYFYDDINNELEIYELKFDKEREILVDQRNNDEYTISPSYVVETNSYGGTYSTVKFWIEKEEEYVLER